MQSLYAFASRVTGAIASLTFTWLIARALSPDGAGQFFFTYSAVLLTAGLVKGGLATLTMREVAVAGDHLGRVRAVNRSMFLALLYGSVGGTVLFALLKGGQTASANAGTIALTASALVVTLAITTVSAHALRGMGSIVKGVLLDTAILYAIAGAAIVVLVPDNAGAILTLSAVSSAVAMTLSFAFARHSMRTAPPTTPIEATLLKSSSRKFVQSSLLLILSSSFGLVLTWGPPLFIGVWHVSSEVAMIVVTMRIALGVTLLVTTIEVVVGPSLSRLQSRESARERATLFWKAWRLLLLLSTPVLLVLFIFSREVLAMFGVEYVQAEHALRLLLVGQFVAVCSGGAPNVLVVTGREVLWARIGGGTAIVAIPLLAILTYHFSFFGAALAVMLTGAAQSAIAFGFVMAGFKSRPDLPIAPPP